MKIYRDHPYHPNVIILYCLIVLYYTTEGSQSFKAVVVPKKLYQLVLTTCHEFNGTQLHSVIVLGT